jgi:hypothetical protein
VESSSVIAQRVDLRLYKGDTFKRVITVTAEGDPFDFSGYSITFVVKEKATDSASVVSLSIGSGITVAANVVTITIPAAETAKLAIKRYAYDLKFISSSGEVSTRMIGAFSVEQDVS